MNQRGFVLPFVVFMLFAISVAGVTGYLVVASEFEMSKYSRDGAEALAVARAGLERFVAEQVGVLPDSGSYAMGDGVAVITTRRLFAQDSVTEYYYLRSEATVTDVRSPGTPARRVVGATAIYHRRPLAHHALVMIGTDRIDVGISGGEIDGFDRDDASDCPGGGASPITGAVARLVVTESDSDDIEGSPDWELWSGGWSAVLDSTGLRWDVLSDPNFPVEFENTMPNFASIPADSFPLIRYTGWMSSSADGRGVLIVDGVFDPASSFRWRGIVLARDIDDITQGHIDGLVVAGLEGPNMYTTIDYRTDSHYHSCYVYAANETLSYLELLPNTVIETN
jgi:hypothetical protein